MNHVVKARDPIFAAIENHRKLNKALHAIWLAADLAEGRAVEKHGFRPTQLCAYRLPAQLRAYRKVYDAEERAAREWDKRAGFTAIRRDVEVATPAEQRAAMQMARTKPRTPAGAGALLAYTKTLMFEVGEMFWHKTALNTIAEALATMEKAPPRSQIKRAA
jgi:hypothetical protein